MDVRYDLWHLAFANLIQNRAPPGFDIQTEVRLTIEPQRADMLLLRRSGAAREDEKAQVLRTLWPLLGLVTILEYKSPVQSSLRPGDLLRLWSYGAVYDAAHLKELPRASDLTLALVLPSVTPTLLEEIARMGWTLTPLGGGYGRIDGAVYALYVVATDEVSQAEHDEFLELFSRHRAHVSNATRWLDEWMKEKEMKQQDIREMEGYREMYLKTLPVEQRLEGLAPEERLLGLAPEERLLGLAPEQRLLGLAPEQRLLGLAPEQRLEGLAPEERLLGLDHDQQALALPIDVLRFLPEEYILSLSPETQAKVRQRIQSGGL